MAKATKKHDDIGYITGVITPNDVIVIVAASEEAENKRDEEHAFLAYYKEKNWTIFEEDFDIVSLAVGAGPYARHVISMGLNGEVLINHPHGVLHEHVHKGKGGPSKLRNMHEVRVVGSHYVAVGMRRQVFRRKLSGGAWSRFDDGVLLADSSTDIAGFASVAGFSDDEVYAVGHRGEIWLAEKGKWKQVASPTNAYLSCVRCGSQDDVVICGDQGLVLSGRRSQWTVVESNGVATKLLSVAELAGKWYVSDEEGDVYVVTESGLQPEPLFAELGIAAGVLDSNGRKLLCAGEEDLALFDGKKWAKVPHPPIDPT